MSDIIVRMPPSPTGHLHLGTARTGLFNFLFAKNQGGSIIFRWEDTDLERSDTKFEAEILEGMKWLGIDFVEASEKFVRQTESAEYHGEMLKKLWEAGLVFPCFLTTEEIDEQRAQARAQKKNFILWSPDRETEKDELESKIESGAPYVWRFRTEKDRVISFEDGIRGVIEVSSNTIGDFTVARTDGSVLYLLANVLDDLDQGITHILRGEDGISNTPKQLMLWEALKQLPDHTDHPIPSYSHIPLVLDQKGAKLSKRKVEPGVCVLIKDFQEQGFLPQGVVNGLAFLGWNPKSEEELFSLEDLVERFSLEGVNKAAAKYDFEKMKWFNNAWMNRLDLEELIESFLDWNETYHDGEYNGIEVEKLMKGIEICRQKAKTFVDLEEELSYLLFPIETPEKELLVNEKMKVDADMAQEVLEAMISILESLDENPSADLVKEKCVEYIQSKGLKNGQFLWPVRFSLSGRERSVGPFDLVAILGTKESLKRIMALAS